jgi:hypothetical protein
VFFLPLSLWPIGLYYYHSPCEHYYLLSRTVIRNIVLHNVRCATCAYLRVWQYGTRWITTRLYLYRASNHCHVTGNNQSSSIWSSALLHSPASAALFAIATWTPSSCNHEAMPDRNRLLAGLGQLVCSVPSLTFRAAAAYGTPATRTEDCFIVGLFSHATSLSGFIKRGIIWENC